MTSATTCYVSRIPIIDGGVKIPAGALFSHIQDRPCAFHTDANGEMIRVQAIHLQDEELFRKVGSVHAVMAERQLA